LPGAPEALPGASRSFSRCDSLICPPTVLRDATRCRDGVPLRAAIVARDRHKGGRPLSQTLGSVLPHFDPGGLLDWLGPGLTPWTGESVDTCSSPAGRDARISRCVASSRRRALTAGFAEFTGLVSNPRRR
jgi:hypothetical protein